MNQEILTTDVQAFIYAHQQEDPSRIALGKSPFDKVSPQELATQIDGLQRVKKKIPEWLHQAGLYFPDKLNLEQCSSSATGRFKAALIAEGSQLIDLTGGFGVDSYYYAHRARHVVHCEINEKLSAIVAHNFRQLHIPQVSCVAGNGIEKIRQDATHYDYLYIDPSRRVKQQKVFRLEDCEPNIVELQGLFFERADTVITKLAPLLDISLATQSLRFVKDIYVVSIDNDCKELLIVQEKGFDDIPTIHAVRLLNDVAQDFSFTSTQEKEAAPSYGFPADYLYDPDVAITKAGAFKIVAERLELQKLHPNTHLYSNKQFVKNFPGRCYHMIAVYPLRAFKKQTHLTKANIITRNFPLRVEEIRKKFKIQDGGEDYLYFCTVENGEHVAIHARRV